MFYNLKITGTEYFPRRVKRKKISTIFSIDAKNFPDSRKFYSKHFLSDRPSKELDRNLAEYLPSNFLFVFPQSDRTLMKKNISNPNQSRNQSRYYLSLEARNYSKAALNGVDQSHIVRRCSVSKSKKRNERNSVRYRSLMAGSRFPWSEQKGPTSINDRGPRAGRFGGRSRAPITLHREPLLL